MSSYDIIQSNFQAGELSPLFSGRSTSQLYNYGMKKAVNVLPLKMGGARRRTGTTYAGALRSGIGDNPWEHNLIYSDGHFYDFSIPYLRIYSYASNDIRRTFHELFEPELEYDLRTMDLYVSKFNIHDIQFVEIGGHKLFLIDGEVCEIFYREQSEDPEVPTGWIVERLSFTGAVTNFYLQRIEAKDGRLIVMRNETLYISKAPDYSLDDPYQFTDFTLGTDPTSAISITHEKFDRLNTWVLSHTKLLAGSGKGVVASADSVIAPETFYMKEILSTGTAVIKPRTLGSSVYMVSSSKRAILCLYYSNDTQSYSVKDITETAQHLFRSDIRSFEILSMGEDILWVLLEDGTVLSCSITQAGELGTYGWSSHLFGERTVTDITKIHETGKRDQLVLISYPGVTDERRDVDILDVPDIFTQPSYCLDSVYVTRSATQQAGTALYYAQPDMVDHEHVFGFLDGKLYQLEVESNGCVTLPVTASEIIIGTSFVSTFGFLSKEIPSNGDSSIYNRRRLKKATVNLFQSLGGSIGVDNSHMYEMLTARYGVIRYGEQPHIVDEIIDMDINSSNMRSAELYVRTDKPTPLNILSIKEKIEILET